MKQWLAGGEMCSQAGSIYEEEELRDSEMP